MARQESIITLVGSIGELSFYNSKYGPIVRRKGGPGAKKIKKGENFERVREHNREFGACGKAGGAMRRAFSRMLRESQETTTVSRLIKLLFAVKNLDGTSVRGARNIRLGLGTAAGKALLKGFEFNAGAPLDAVLKKTYQLSAGAGSLSISGFKPRQHLKVPKGATEVCLRYAVLEMDFDSSEWRLYQSTDTVVPISNSAVPVLLDSGCPAMSPHCLVGVLQVCFYQDINGQLYALKDHGHNAMGIVSVI